MIFETHAHYDDSAFDADREEILTSVHRGYSDEGEPVGRIINCGANLATSRASVELAGQHEYIYAAVGVHPDDAGDLLYDDVFSDPAERENADYTDPKKLELLKKLAAEKRVVAIGEIGLDYHWNKWPHEIQKDVFVKQWELAVQLGLPVEIHSRDAAEDTFEIVKMMYRRELEEGRSLRAELHCYSYSVEHAREYEKMGLYFGVGGVVTFKNARKTHELVSEILLERILLETDCPYLAPEPYRGQRNNSGYIARAAAKIAELRGITVEEVYRVTYDNACRFFDL